MGLFNYISNYSNSDKKFNCTNIKNYLFAKWNKAKAESQDDEQWRHEQASWRLEQVVTNSPECIQKNACKLCGCEWEDGLHYELNSCNNACYPKWLSKESWHSLLLLKDELSTLYPNHIPIIKWKDYSLEIKLEEAELPGKGEQVFELTLDKEINDA